MTQPDKKARVTSREPMTAIDLFAGAGGATQGLSDAGFRVLAAIEKDEDAAKTFATNHPDVLTRADDISQVSPTGLIGDLGLARGDLTLLTACPPCQGFSTLGPGNAGDKRNDLVAEVWKFAQALQPHAVLIENVPGLSRDHRWKRLRRQLRSSGYRFRSWTVNAKDFGVPQRRRRLIAIAIRSAEVVFPSDLRHLLPQEFTLEAPHAREVIARAGPIETSSDAWHRARTPTPRVLERIRAIPQNGDRYDLPVSLRLDCHERLRVQGRRAATGAYGRIQLEGPAPTMTTRCTTVSCGQFVHPTENRGISLREAALLQTFPEDYAFHGSYQSIERQIGNAVPVRLAHALGIALRGILLPHESSCRER